MFCALLGQDIRSAFTGPLVLLFKSRTESLCACVIVLVYGSRPTNSQDHAETEPQF